MDYPPEYQIQMREVWNNLLNGSEDLVTIGEDDLRRYLFSSCTDILRGSESHLFEIHSDIQPAEEGKRERADLVLGFDANEHNWNVGVEIKAYADCPAVKEDLEKLRTFIEKKEIEVGVFLGLVHHSYELKEKLRDSGVLDHFGIGESDNRINNFAEWREIKMGVLPEKDLDAVFLVLRSKSHG